MNLERCTKIAIIDDNTDNNLIIEQFSKINMKW